MLYVDHAATSPVRPEAFEAMRPYLEERYGNPSGIHGISRAAKDALEDARERVAQALSCQPLEVIFTGGGTEADNLALKGATQFEGKKGGVVTVATEHEAVLESVDYLRRMGHPVTVLPVDHEGRVDPDAVVAALEPETVLVSVMWANNETGALQPIDEIAAAVKAARPDVLFHTDAVQAVLSEPVDFSAVDLLSISGHKFGGPKGTGVLVAREGVGLEPVIHGGGQELGRRSGTQDVAGAVGLAVALEATVADRPRLRRSVGEARRRFEEILLSKVPEVRVNAPLDARLIQHSHVAIPGIRNETILIRLDRLGIAASAGSACQSGATSPSHVLMAMGLTPEESRQCLRFTFGWTTEPEDGDLLASGLLEAIG